jgi:7-cyano-7-deazaguanine synthase
MSSKFVNRMHQCTKYISLKVHKRYTSGTSKQLEKSGDVLLMSGGIESSTLLHLLASQHRENSTTAYDINNQIFPIFANYGQRGHLMELKASQHMCDAVGVKLEIIDLNMVGEFFRSRQKQKRHVPVPHRNFTLLSIALGYCSQLISESAISKMNLHLGLNQEDLNKPAYQSGTLEFVESFKSICRILDPKVTIQTPLIQYSKSEIIHLARELQVDLAKTYSCMTGRENHCGNCMQCKSRKAAFLEARVEEPEGFYL